MKRVILLASLVLGGVLNAQSNEQLAEKLENEKIQNLTEFDFYIQEKMSQLSTKGLDKKAQDSLKLALQKDKENLAFFFEGQPYFLTSFDTDQIKNNNVENIHSGQIAGLNGSFQGNGIKVSVFDGGPINERHVDFGGNGNRITHREDTTLFYDSHATGVAGVIGGQGHNLSSGGVPVGNSKGMMPLSHIDSYSFSTSTLLGENSPKSNTEKLLTSLAYLSNHSYGTTPGWRYQPASFRNAGAGWYWNGFYAPGQQPLNLAGTYFSSDRDFDDIIYNNPSMIVVKSAGNSYGAGDNTRKRFYTSNAPGNINGYMEFKDTDNIPPSNCGSGFDCIGSGSLAKNIIIVGATEKITTNQGKYAQASDVVKAEYSSAGPRDDGAIRPDIAAVGSEVLMASTNQSGSNGWQMNYGTSFSAPQVTGIMGLWLEIYKKLNNNQMFNAASAKTLLIHTAMEAGNIGPDVHFGWGFADAQAGAELIVKKSENKIIFEEKTLANKEKETIYLKSNGKEPLKVSISWIDPSYKVMPRTFDEANNNRTSNLINDFDLRITNIKTNEVFYPWKLDVNNPMAPAIKGDNLVDNVEQVLIEKPTAGVYKVEISHKGDLIDNNGNNANSQNYSIIATGYEDIIAPELIPNLIDPSDVVVYPTLLSDVNSEATIHHLEKNIESVDVYDMSGRLFHSEKVNTKEHKLNFSKYATGVYIINIKLSNSRETITRKVIKK